MIRKRSIKRQIQEREYIKLRKQFLIDNPTCKVCGQDSTDAHHSKGRTGALLTDVQYFVAVCRQCHVAIEENPNWAKEMGYSVSRLAK